MLSITHSSQRFHAIDQAVNQLPQVVTRIISEYDCTNEELRKIVKTMTIVNMGFHGLAYRSNPCPLFTTAALADAEYPPADIIIELIDKFEDCGPLDEQGPSNKRIVFTAKSEGQPNTPYHKPERQYYYCINQSREPFYGSSKGPERVLLEIIGGFGKHLFLKNGDMSHRMYSNNFLDIFKNATFININFTGTTFINQFFTSASFIDCDLTDVTFDYCSLESAKFSGSTLKNTIFKNFTTLSYASFKDVIFDDTQFIQSLPDNDSYLFSTCYKVVATDRLFLAKIRMHCSWYVDRSTCIPTPTTLCLDNNTSFQYTSPSKPFQKWISSCPIL